VGSDVIPTGDAVLELKPGFDGAGYLMESEGKLTPSASVDFGAHSPRGKARWHEQ
jgi:hypothetical protein